MQVVFDCRDPDGLSKFYAEALRHKAQDPPEGFESWEEALEAWGIPEEDRNFASAIVYPEGKGPRIYFRQMDAPKLGKNRVHLDVNASGGSRATIHDVRLSSEPRSSASRSWGRRSGASGRNGESTGSSCWTRIATSSASSSFGLLQT